LNNSLVFNSGNRGGSDAFMPFRVLIATCRVILNRDAGIAPTGTFIGANKPLMVVLHLLFFNCAAVL
jgi:hypothetical protein